MKDVVTILAVDREKALTLLENRGLSQSDIIFDDFFDNYDYEADSTIGGSPTPFFTAFSEANEKLYVLIAIN